YAVARAERRVRPGAPAFPSFRRRVLDLGHAAAEAQCGALAVLREGEGRALPPRHVLLPRPRRRPARAAVLQPARPAGDRERRRAALGRLRGRTHLARARDPRLRSLPAVLLNGPDPAAAPRRRAWPRRRPLNPRCARAPGRRPTGCRRRAPGR